MKVNNDGLEAVAVAADLSAYEGYFVDSSQAVMASATAVPDALIIDAGIGAGSVVTLAPTVGGVPGVVTTKANATPGTINKGTNLALCSDGTVKADPGTGARVLVAQARESATAAERFKSVLISPPIVFGS